MQFTYAALAAALTPSVLALATDKVSMRAFYASNLAHDAVIQEWQRRGGYGVDKGEAYAAARSIREALVEHYQQMPD